LGWLADALGWLAVALGWLAGALGWLADALGWLAERGAAAAFSNLFMWAAPPFATVAVFVCYQLVGLGLGRIVALHHRSSTACQSHYHTRHLFFWSGNATEP
jgi:hypothetical protein